MKLFKWTIAAVGGLAVAAIIAVAALGGSITQAQQPDSSELGTSYDEALAGQLGITVDELKAARAIALDEVLADAVASGRITQEQADRIKEHPRAARGVFHHRVVKNLRGAVTDVFAAAAKTIGISPDELKAELREGQSLAQVAETNDVSIDELKAGITTEIDAQLAAAVASGKLTQEQADKIADGIAERLDNILAREGGLRRPHNNP